MSRYLSRQTLFFSLFSAVVDKACDFAAEVFSVDNHIDKTVFDEEFSPLKSAKFGDTVPGKKECNFFLTRAS